MPKSVNMYNQPHPEWSNADPRSPWQQGNHYTQGPPLQRHYPAPPSSGHRHHHLRSTNSTAPPARQYHSSSPHPGYYVNSRPSTPYVVHSMQHPSMTPRQQSRVPSQMSPAPQIVASSPVAAASTAISPGEKSSLITAKPPRPYTEYTMFYQLEREFILHRLLLDENDSVPSPEEQNKVALFKNDPLMPQKYRELPLRADWYISGKSKKPTKRKHRKTHGKIGFLELTRMIAKRWGNVDDETRKYCKMMAAMELVKYKEDMESYNMYKDQLSAIGEIPEDMKEKVLKRKQKEEKTGVARKTMKAQTNRAVKADDVSSSTMMPPLAVSKLRPIHRSTQGKNKIENDMDRFISSLVNDEHRPAPVAHFRDDVHYGSGPPQHYQGHDASWANYYQQGPELSSVALAKITPERSSKRRKLPLQNDIPMIRHSDSNISKVSPDELLEPEDTIHMTFSGIDENEIAREFYMNGQNTTLDSPGADDLQDAGAVANAPQELFRSFDYWESLVEPPNA